MAESQDIKTNIDPTSLENYEKFRKLDENARMEYEQAYAKMWSHLNESHLEPLAKIMQEQENVVLKGQDHLVESIRKQGQKAMVASLNNFWQNFGVSEAIISLAMCKEKFKSYEGHNWDMNSKTPEDRTRPIRMRYKQNRLRYLNAQLEYQQRALDDAMKQNIALRHQIQEVKQEREMWMENIEKYRKKLADDKKEILRLTNELINERENDAHEVLAELQLNDDGTVNNCGDQGSPVRHLRGHKIFGGGGEQN